jgi:ankyrin repeat protein
LCSNPGYILERAACSSSILTIDLLLEYGARVENSFALNEAASKENNTAMMERLIELGADLNGFEDSPYVSFDGTPLHRAIRSGLMENVRFLLEKGADPYFKDSPWRRTPLEEAENSARSEIPEIVELLENAARLRSAAKGA